MIKFKKNESKLILIYESDSEIEWLFQKFMDNESHTIRNTFTFDESHLISKREDENSFKNIYNRDYSVEFLFGKLKGDFYELDSKVLGISNKVFLYKEIDIKTDLFIAVNNISIFSRIDKLLSEDIFIGGDFDYSMPEEEFRNLLRMFPNSYELKKYSEARLATVLRNYFDATVDGESKFNKYMNNRISKYGENLSNTLKTYELDKFQAIHKKLDEMLNDENNYNERQWQKEILDIILLLFPKYIFVFEEVSIRDTYNDTNRSIDYLLLDSTGNVDIVEIKKPFDNCIITKSKYRDNFIPLRELSGTVMQIEKYIFYLNKWGKFGEKKLIEQYKDKLPSSIKVHITNPNGLIIMGREKGLTESQLLDFEVIKRKYKNVIDIITYDDLLKRLSFTIEQIEKR